MKPSPSPLNCKSYVVTELAIKANHDYDPDCPTQLSWDKIDVEASKLRTEDERYPWQLTLRVDYLDDGESNIPYDFSVTMVGWFSVAKNFPEERMERMLEVSGYSILYNVARETLRTSMAKGPYCPVLLPTVSFFTTEETAPATNAIKNKRLPIKKVPKKIPAKTAVKKTSKTA